MNGTAHEAEQHPIVENRNLRSPSRTIVRAGLDQHFVISCGCSTACVMVAAPEVEHLIAEWGAGVNGRRGDFILAAGCVRAVGPDRIAARGVHVIERARAGGVDERHELAQVNAGHRARANVWHVACRIYNRRLRRMERHRWNGHGNPAHVEQSFAVDRVLNAIAVHVLRHIECDVGHVEERHPLSYDFVFAAPERTDVSVRIELRRMNFRDVQMISQQSLALVLVSVVRLSQFVRQRWWYGLRKRRPAQQVGLNVERLPELCAVGVGCKCIGDIAPEHRLHGLKGGCTALEEFDRAGIWRMRARVQLHDLFQRDVAQLAEDVADGRLGEDFRIAVALQAEAQNPIYVEPWHPHAEIAAVIRHGCGNLFLITGDWEEPQPRRLHREEAEQAFSTARSLIEELAANVPDEQLRTHFLSQATALLPQKRSLTPGRAAKEASGGLTAREREVAALIAQGKSNREIAGALVLSERTIETHVANIMFKLSVQSRRQIRDWALEKGLPSHS